MTKRWSMFRSQHCSSDPRANDASLFPKARRGQCVEKNLKARMGVRVVSVGQNPGSRRMSDPLERTGLLWSRRLSCRVLRRRGGPARTSYANRLQQRSIRAVSTCISQLAIAVSQL